MDFQQVKDLIHMIDGSSLTELHVEMDGCTLRMSKNASMGAPTEPVSAAQTTAAAASITPSIDEPVTILPEGRPAVKEGDFVTSPLVGTFYTSASPDKPAFVSAGGAVKAGQVLCIVEAMKVMNEITAKRDGVVAEVLAENEQMVEFGQPLFRIV